MKPPHDLSRMMKFIERDDVWGENLAEAIFDHLSPARDQFDLDQDDLAEILGEHWTVTLFGCALEDLLTRIYEPAGPNLVDDYLARRGWAEDFPNKTYLRALRGSVMSLYEVSEVTPGQSFLARDLIRGGEPVLVSEMSATRSLKTWDRIAARIVPLRQKYILAGGVLPFSLEASEVLIEGLRKAEDGHSSGSTPLAITDETLRELAHLFTTAWLFDVLPRAMGDSKPVLHNTDGDEIVFHEVHFPLKSGVKSKEVSAALDRVAALQKENGGLWNWIDPAGSRKPQTSGGPGLTWNIMTEHGAPVLGNVKLSGRKLFLSVNSAARATKGGALLEAVLGDLVGPSLTQIQTIDQIREATAGEAPPRTVPAEVATPMVHAMLDKQYRATLDQPVGMLGDVTPRKAIRSAAGRNKVVSWLKFLENRSAPRNDPTDPMATYDFGWMWRELGVAELRR